MQDNFKPDKIKLIIGLGNPGREYEKTYHNVGFLFADYLTKNLSISNFQFIISKPDTYMNQSGEFVRKLTKKTRMKPEELLIVHDDSDLIIGNHKLSFGSGSAGHKGVESIIKLLGTKDFWRLRIGIRPLGFRQIGSRRLELKKLAPRLKAEDFVLEKITIKDKKILEDVFKEILSRLSV